MKKNMGNKKLKNKNLKTMKKQKKLRKIVMKKLEKNKDVIL